MTIKTTKLTKNNVGSNAFKGLNVNAIVAVPSGKLKIYTSILKVRGLNGKNQKVKENGTVDTEAESKSNGTSSTAWDNYTPGQPLPELESAGFTIGDFSKQNPGYMNNNKVLESTEYIIGNDIPFTACVQMNRRLYGDWKEEKITFSTPTGTTSYQECGYCRRNFQTDEMMGLHYGLMCMPANYYIHTTAEPFNGWNFYPDNDPCKVVYQFTLSDGLSYKDGSLKLKAVGKYDIGSENCVLQVSGNHITVTIEDVKSEPFYTQFDKAAYDRNPYSYKSTETEGALMPINVLFSANFNEDAAAVNTVSASVTYSYKGKSRTVDLGSRRIYAASIKISHTDTDGNQLSGGAFTLYAQEAVYKEGSSLGTYEWKAVKSGLKSGDVVGGIGNKYYKLVQDTFPEGYKKYITPEFSVGIEAASGGATVIAEDNNSWTPLEVVNGVVQVPVKNTRGISQAQNYNKTVETGNIVKNPATKTETAAPAVSTADVGQSLDVVVTYYKDSVKESSMLYKTNESIASGILDTKNISSRSYVFKGCTLQKITLNGEEVDKVPGSVKAGSAICFYYVTDEN